MADTKGYLPTLDGWRAIAVFAVILFHDSSHAFGPFGTNWFQEHGTIGVDIFFGISGLLICSRLLQEEAARGKIDLKQFYIRRAFRILPPALCYLTILGGLGIAGVLPLIPKEWFAALLFYRNYTRLSSVAGHIDWYTSHYWSLAVEEHFYLILPTVLVVVPQSWRTRVLTTMIVVVAAWRAYRQQTRPYIFLSSHTDTRLDALLIPATIAILLTRPRARSIVLGLAKFWPLFAVATFCLVSSNRFPVLTPLAQSLFIPMVLVGTLSSPEGVLSKILELFPLRWIGRISYSLYLWQQMFFNGHFYPWLKPLGVLQTFPMRWLMLFGCAAASYYLIEKPSIRFGHRLATPVTPGRPET